MFFGGRGLSFICSTKNKTCLVFSGVLGTLGVAESRLELLSLQSDNLHAGEENKTQARTGVAKRRNNKRRVKRMDDGR